MAEKEVIAIKGTVEAISKKENGYSVKINDAWIMFFEGEPTVCRGNPVVVEYCETISKTGNKYKTGIKIELIENKSPTPPVQDTRSKEIIRQTALKCAVEFAKVSPGEGKGATYDYVLNVATKFEEWVWR
jgi:hypothetical protein